MSRRYDFGRNWKEFARELTPEAIKQAERGVAKLVDDLRGKSFLDIGSGSGLHSLAAINLGATRVVAFDYDPDSVETTRSVLMRFADGANWQVSCNDILAFDDQPLEQFDIVYSWGVLHHTGDMWRAIANAMQFVAPNGLCAIALYRQTPFCGAWHAEKKLYAGCRAVRPLIRYPFAVALLFVHLLKGGNPVRYVRTYITRRGMAFMKDIDDWLGGYPYQSVDPAALVEYFESCGFMLDRAFSTERHIGLFGAGCAEWTFRRGGDSSATGY